MPLALWLSECSHSRGGIWAGPSGDHRRQPSLGLLHIRCEPHGHATELLLGCKSRTLTFIKPRELLNQMRFQKVTPMKLLERDLFPISGGGGGTAQREKGLCSFLSVTRSRLSIFLNSITTFMGLNTDPQRDTSMSQPPEGIHVENSPYLGKGIIPQFLFLDP